MDIVTISVVLGFAAGATQLAGYWVYNRGAGGKVNTGSWVIWAVGGIVDLASFFALTGDWVINILPAVCAAAAVSTFGYAYARKRFSWPDPVDWLFVGADAAITVVWYFTNVVVANLLYQASAVASFVPMCRGLLSDKEREKPLAWLIWTLAYGLLTASVFLRLERWEELVYPVGNVVTHIAVALIATAKQRSPR